MLPLSIPSPVWLDFESHRRLVLGRIAGKDERPHALRWLPRDVQQQVLHAAGGGQQSLLR